MLDIGADLEFVSPERRALMVAGDSILDLQHAAAAVSLVDDEPLEVEMRDVPTVRATRQAEERANVEQAPSTLDFYNAIPRPIRAHRSRHNHYQSANRYPSNGHSLFHHPHCDLDDARGRAFHDQRQYREPSPDTLRNHAEATYVSAMADVDVKEERDDRRDGDRYRGGGNNKRRRDGKLATRMLQRGRITDTHT
jgi:hypothetical protein